MTLSSFWPCSESDNSDSDSESSQFTDDESSSEEEHIDYRGLRPDQIRQIENYRLISRQETVKNVQAHRRAE